jgi:hypothetical protein
MGNPFGPRFRLDLTKNEIIVLKNVIEHEEEGVNELLAQVTAEEICGLSDQAYIDAVEGILAKVYAHTEPQEELS